MFLNDLLCNITVTSAMCGQSAHIEKIKSSVRLLNQSNECLLMTVKIVKNELI